MGLWFRDWGTTGYITYQLYNDPLAKRGVFRVVYPHVYFHFICGAYPPTQL